MVSPEGARPAGDPGNQARLEGLQGQAGAFDDPVVPLPFLGMMERSFGRSFAQVRCHVGPAAQAATAAAGSQGMAQGQDVCFARADPAPWLVAHELAHVVQQQGGAPVPGAPDVEADADQVAGAVMAGRPVTVQARSSVQLRHFTGAEHVEIGDRAADKALDNLDLSDAHAELQTDRKDGKTLSFGQANKQAGDKYDTAREFNIGLTRNDKQDYAQEDLSKSEVIQANGNIRSENKAEVRSLLGEARSQGYDKDNFAHTWEVNQQEWATFHSEAISHAADGKLQRALRNEAFAAHFLQDGHAAGHLVPRAIEVAAGGHRLDEPQSGVSWHDYFNEHGMATTRGILYGDGFLSKAPTNVLSATRASLEEVLVAWQTGEVRSSELSGRFPEPILDPADLADMKIPSTRMDGQEITVSDEGYLARAEGLLPKQLEMLAAHEGWYEDVQAMVAAGQSTLVTPAGDSVSLAGLVEALGPAFAQV